jgi:hypothetical protein
MFSASRLPLPLDGRDLPEGPRPREDVSRAVIVVVAGNEDGKREVLGIATACPRQRHSRRRFVSLWPSVD